MTDGWKVYPNFIADEAQIISQTYRTRVEGENKRLRHYLARVKPKNICYSQSGNKLLRHSLRFLIHYLKFADLSIPYQNQINYFGRMRAPTLLSDTLIQPRLFL